MAQKPIGPVVVLVLFVLSGCAGPHAAKPHTGQDSTRSVWLVTPGWHSGLVLRRDDIPPEWIPEHSDFEGASHLEFGWGDRDYYRAPDPTPWLALKAALIPGPAVLFLRGLDGAPEAYFIPGEIQRIDLPAPAFRRILAYLHGSFLRHGRERALPLEPRPHGSSRFYEAEGQFHLFNNCNAWTARALRSAGLPLAGFPAMTATALRCQAQRWGGIESER